PSSVHVGRRSIVALAIVAALVAGSAIAVAIHRASPAPVAPPVPAPVVPTEPTRGPIKPAASGIPRWWSALPEPETPALRPPRDIAFGEATGEYVNQIDGSVLVFVPHGRFRMGSVANENEQPIHEVELSPYFLGKREVTVAQFSKFSRASRHVTTAESEKI